VGKLGTEQHTQMPTIEDRQGAMVDIVISDVTLQM